MRPGSETVLSLYCITFRRPVSVLLERGNLLAMPRRLTATSVRAATEQESDDKQPLCEMDHRHGLALCYDELLPSLDA